MRLTLRVHCQAQAQATLRPRVLGLLTLSDNNRKDLRAKLFSSSAGNPFRA